MASYIDSNLWSVVKTEKNHDVTATARGRLIKLRSIYNFLFVLIVFWRSRVRFWDSDADSVVTQIRVLTSVLLANYYLNIHTLYSSHSQVIQKWQQISFFFKLHK